MTRHVLIAVLLAALMAMGAPASAYNASSSATLASDAALEVGSQHTTDSDFNSAQTLENVTIQGGGSTANIVFNTGKMFDDVEDGDIAEYAGDTGNFSVESTSPINGSYSIRHDSDTNWHNIYDTGPTVKQGDAINGSFQFDGSATADNHAAGLVFGVQSESSDGGFAAVDTYLAYVGDTDNDGTHNLVLFKWSGGSQTTLVNEETGAAIPKGETWKLSVDWAADGTITGSLIKPDGTTQHSVQATDTTFTSGGIGWVGQGSDSNASTLYDNYQTSGGSTGQYISANHSVENAQQAWLNTSLTNATTTATLQGWDGTKWTDIATRGISKTSNETVSLSGTYSKYRWDTRLTELNHKAVSRWDANEGSGTTLNDKVDTNHGEFNETDWDTSIYKTGGASVYVDSTNNDLLASDDYVFFKQNEPVNDSQFTWTGWVRPAANDSNQAILNSWNGSDGIRLHLRKDGSVSFNVTLTDGTVTQVRGGNLETDSWHLITAGRDKNGQMFLRVNTTTVASKAANGLKMSDSDAELVWGINSNDKDTLTYLGHIDESGMWNRTLSTEETRLLYNNPAAFNESVAKIHDEGVLFQNTNPTVNNSNASPNSTVIMDDQATLSVPVNDSQFGTAQGEELTVEFFLNGTSKGTTTMTSNGTAEKTVTGLTGGQKQWHVEIQDSYADSVSSDTFTFQVPDELKVFNESAPTKLVNETGVNITARFYESDSDTVITRNTTDGTISMTGLDPTKQFIIVAKADGYHDRRIIIDSLVDQQEIYMLNKSQDSVHNRFYLDDRTGQFDSEDTKLYIERALTKDWDGDGDNETQFNTISADYFGASGGFPVDLAADQRYRLRLENDDGDTRVLGSYTADASGDVTLQVGSSTHDLGNKTENYEWEANYQNKTGPELSFKFDDDEDVTEDLSLVIYERGNESNEIHNETYAGPLGSLAVSEPLTANQSEKTWVVDWEATRNGNTISGRRIIGQRSGPGIPLSPIWKHTASIGLLIALGGLFGGVRAEMGAIIVSMVAGVLWYIQWLPGAVSGGMVVLALGVSILYHQAGGGR